jgi:hypothetical protein
VDGGLMNSKFSVKFYEHKKLTDEIISEIIYVKSKQWKYSFDQHKKWIESNLKNEDIHVLLYSNNKIVAYSNLVSILVNFDGKQTSCLGVGNVCASERSKGYGLELMTKVNEYLISNKKIGLLFCREVLLKFYTSLGWKQLQPKQYQIPLLIYEAMVFNLSGDFSLLEYNDKLF